MKHKLKELSVEIERNEGTQIFVVFMFVMVLFKDISHMSVVHNICIIACYIIE